MCQSKKRDLRGEVVLRIWDIDVPLRVPLYTEAEPRVEREGRVDVDRPEQRDLRGCTALLPVPSTGQATP